MSGKGADPFALPAEVPAEEPEIVPKAISLEAWAKASAAKGIQPSPASCAAVERPKRDVRLEAFERSGSVSVGTMSALRADLAPVECADRIVDPLLKKSQALSDGEKNVLVALSLASKLARTVGAPPAFTGASDKASVLAFVRGPFKTWIVTQATAIETLSSGAAGLVGYGRGIAAIEAGSADLRLVDTIRSSPLPANWDRELREVYEVALDEALEPRKKRGRDAALVGLADFAKAGIVHDARVGRARALLSKLYGGRRIDALDALALPPRDSEPSPTVPKFWTDTIPELRETDRVEPTALRKETLRARFVLGQTYWRCADFVTAAHAAKESKEPEDRFYLALSLALAHGPKSASEMMRADSPEALDLDHTEALDALSAEKGPFAAIAAFDAAYLRALSPPSGPAAPPYFRDVAARFRKAAGMLGDRALVERANKAAVDADAAARAFSDQR